MQANESSHKMSSLEDEGIDLVELFGVLFARKILIISITLIFAIGALLYAIFSTPIYKATAMVQVEESGPSMPGFDDMAGMFEETSKSVTEIELLKSRRVIGEAVDTLKLDIIAEPNLFPAVGGKFYRDHKPATDGALASAKLGAISYAWGGEQIEVFRLELPSYLMNVPLTLRAEEENQITLQHKKSILLQGEVGQDLAANGVALSVRNLSARPGTEFTLMRKDRFQTILGLQQEIEASEKGKDSGIILLSYQSENPQLAKEILNQIAEIYVRQNVERNSAEAQKSLDFLKVQLPEVKKQLEEAEQKFNDYQIRQKSVDISLETQGVLEQIVELETKLQELELRRLEMSRRFKREHPLYQGVVEQIELVKEQKDALTTRVTDLPETQQELLRYTRDVQVSSEIYTMLLGKVQELDIVRAGTVGNVRIVDHAAVDLLHPVAPRKSLLVVLITLLGFGLACAYVLIVRAIYRGLEDPSEVESIGMPVYVTIPQSDKLPENSKSKAIKGKRTGRDLLAVDHPTDLSVEALRGLRTSLHFAMLNAKNNVIAISGPSPGIGKSFVCTNLGAVIAQGGKKVLLIDGDMRRGDLQEHLGMSFDAGLTGYLSGQYALEEVVRTTVVEELDILPRGIVAPNPAELLMHPRFSELINYASETYDLVIIDTPPVLAVTDPLIIASHAGTLLMVARYGITHKKELEIIQQRCEQNGVSVQGIVFNGIQMRGGKYYGSYGYYNYEYGNE